MANNGIVSVVKERKDEIIDLIAAGHSLKDIAEKIGVSGHQAIIQRIGDDPEYQEAMQASAWHKLQKREAQLEIADNNVAVTRADRLLGHARWFAERVARRWFSPETRVTGADGGPITVRIVRYGETIEGEATTISSSQPPEKIIAK